MTEDKVATALREAESACPCQADKSEYDCNPDAERFCACWDDEDSTREACKWPGHAAIREAMRAAAGWGADYTNEFSYERGSDSEGEFLQELDSILGPEKEG